MMPMSRLIVGSSFASCVLVALAQPIPDEGVDLPLLLAQSTVAPSAGAQKSTRTTPASQLGDLSAFRAIAVDTLKIVNAGDMSAAKKRIKDLELSWDQAEPKLKPMAPKEWDTIDVAIDRALKELRAWTGTQAKSREALRALISTIDAAK